MAGQASVQTHRPAGSNPPEGHPDPVAGAGIGENSPVARIKALYSRLDRLLATWPRQGNEALQERVNREAAGVADEIRKIWTEMRGA